ncbi:MFS transporter [Streptomyces sp. NPDC002851]
MSLRDRLRTPWGTTWLLLAFMLVNFADKAVLGLAGPETMREFGLSRQEFGTAQTAFFSLFSLSALAVSYLTRTVRTAVLLGAMALLWSAAQLPMLIGAAGFTTLVATRVLLGAAEGPAAPVAVHHVHGWFGQRERTLPTAVLMVGAAARVAVAAPALTLVIDVLGWRWAFGAVGLVGLVWAALWGMGGAEGPLAPPVGTRAEVPDDGPDVPLARIFRSGTFLTACLGAFAAYWLMSAKLTWTPDYLETVRGWSGRTTGLAVGAMAVVNGVVLLAHGLLARRAARRPAPPRLPDGAGAGLLVLGSAAAVAVFATTGAAWLSTALMFGPMALALVMLTVAQTACARITPPSRRGVVLGALVAVFALAGALAPLLLGRIVDAAASPAAGYERAWLVTAALLAVAGALATAFLRPQRDAARLGLPEEAEGTEGAEGAVTVAH